MRKDERGMDLAEARRIGVRPQAFRSRLWERALRILIRWATEPCVQKEYQKRITLCRKVHQALLEWAAKIEKARNKKWKFKASINKEPSEKVGKWLRQLNGLSSSVGGLAKRKLNGKVRRSTKRKLVKRSQRTTSAKPRGKISATSRR